MVEMPIIAWVRDREGSGSFLIDAAEPIAL